MKQRTSLFNRGIALVLALMLLVSQANMGILLHAHADEFDVNTTIAQIIADNYDLSEAEKNLLKSGYLVSDSFAYNVPANEDSLVSVDTENAKITAAGKYGWVPTKAVITYGTKTLDVALTDGVGTYDAAVVGNAFSVSVVYQLDTTVSVDVQKALLGAGELLKQGVKNPDEVAAQAGNLYILEQAMPELVNLANNGVDTGIPGLAKVELPEGGKTAVAYLDEQMTANGGVLNLSKMITEYNASAKTAYLIANGAAMQAEAAAFVAKTGELVAALNYMANSVEMFMNYGAAIDPTLVTLIKTLANSVDTLYNGLNGVSQADWHVTEAAALVKADADYAKLDALVAKLGEATAVTVKETLKVAETSVQVNMSMFNVTYKVVVMHTVDNVVVEGYTTEKMVTLAEGATEAEIAAEFVGMDEQALAASGIYVEGKFDRTADKFPAALTEDLTIVVTYAPKNYNVTIAGETASYPYGYVVTLPVHADAAKSYDYKDANGKYYPQGSKVVVENEMTFTREEGKSYTEGNLFAIIAENYATDKVAAILNSGAVKGNEVIAYREPSAGELETLVALDGNTLRVQAYPSSYAGLNWVPYSYELDGVEHLLNGKTEVDLGTEFMTVKVYYRLVMTNYTEADVKAIFDMVAELVKESEGQKSVMDRLAGYEEDMSALNTNMLLGLNGMLDGQVGKYGEALVNKMKAAVTDILNNSFDKNGNLKLNLIIASYNDPNNGGLGYYYQNAEEIRGEISFLSSKLEDLLGDPKGKELLGELLTSLGYGLYVQYLDDLKTNIAQIKADLAPVNANIDTTDAVKLSALAKALSAEGSVEVSKVANPYIQMGPVIRTAERYVTVEVKATAGGKTATFPITIEKNTALTQAQVNELKAQINAFVGGVIETAYYNNNFAGGAELDALVGVALAKGANFAYTWTVKEYTVKIEGEADQTVTVESLTITLPEHKDVEFGLSYEYTIGSKTAKAGIFTFEKTDLLNLFKNGELTITRIVKNANVETLEQMVADINIAMDFKALELVSKDGVYTGINANISAEDLMNLMMNLVMKSKYGYIGLNNDGFIYSNEGSLELSIQTLINAVLNDESFSNQTFIALGENGKGKLLTASMQLGSKKDDLAYSDLTFTVNLKSVPQQLVDYVSYIELISGYISFYSDNGALAFELNLPDQAYAVYASALVAAGHVEKTDINGLTQMVPVHFLYDYLTAITDSEMDLETYSNTLEMLGINRSLAAYNKYYTGAMDAYNSRVHVSITDDKTSVGLDIPGKRTINALLSLLGGNNEMIQQFLPMLKEYKSGDIVINATAKLMNVEKTYYALILDLEASGITNKMEAPSSYAALAEETKELAGYSYVILTADVPGDLTVAGTTVLDLNGFNVAGTINATGKLIVIDSCLGNNTAGGALNVTGNATILAGNYGSDVSSKLLAGCYLENGTVRNAMYKVEEDENGNLTFVLDGNYYENMSAAGYVPDAKALAINIAIDILMNYANTAKVALGGYDLVAMEFNDLVGLYASDNRIAELAKMLLGCFTIGEAGYENNAGFEGVVNMILADLLDFQAITDALNNNTALFTYELTTAPWTIEIDHIEDGNYATVNVGYNAKLEKSINVSLVVESKFNDNVSAMTGILADIVVKDETYMVIDLPAPTFNNSTLGIFGGIMASFVMDMSHNTDYATAIAVVLAYGNPAKAEAVAAAVNNNDMAALKKVIDNTTVAEFFTALKKLDRNTNYAAMAKKVGVASSASVAQIEGAFHLALCAAGKSLELLNITGMNSKLGGLYNAETGYYELSKKDIFRDTEIGAAGYAALIELEAKELTLKVKLFGEIPECLWGDANHDNVVNSDDASLVEEYVVNGGEMNVEFCTIRTDVNGDGVINTDDASLIREYVVGNIDVFPAENK